jgi:hypothetical protein
MWSYKAPDNINVLIVLYNILLCIICLNSLLIFQNVVNFMKCTIIDSYGILGFSVTARGKKLQSFLTMAPHFTHTLTRKKGV